MILLIKVILLVITIMIAAIFSAIQLWNEVQWAGSILCIALGTLICIAYIIQYINKLKEETNYTIYIIKED